MTHHTSRAYHIVALLPCGVSVTAFPTLLHALQIDHPRVMLGVEPFTDQDPKVRYLHLRIPVSDAYESGTRCAWSSIETTVRRVLQTTVADEVLSHAQYHVSDAEGQRVGQIIRRSDARDACDLLDQEPLIPGTRLELLAGHGVWIAGRYDLASGGDQPSQFFPYLWPGTEGEAVLVTDTMIFRRSG